MAKEGFGQTVVPSTVCDLSFCLFVLDCNNVIYQVSYTMNKQDVDKKINIAHLRKKLINKNKDLERNPKH